MSKGIKILIPIIVGAGIIGFSIFLIAKNMGDEDWDVVKEITEEATEVKNEPKGCCPPHDGLLTPTECEQSGGDLQSWFEGECPGFGVQLSGSNHAEFSGGGSGDFTYEFDLHTCADTVYSDWEGTWSVHWLWTTPEGNEVPGSMTNESISFTVSKDGKGSQVIYSDQMGQRTAFFQTDGKEMSFLVDHDDPVEASAEIIKGSGLCVE